MIQRSIKKPKALKNMKNFMARNWAKVSGVVAVLGASATTFAAHAQTAFAVIPTSTAPSLTADIGAQFSDPGTLLVIGLAAGIPLTFYVIHQLIGLLPKSRGRRN